MPPHPRKDKKKKKKQYSRGTHVQSTPMMQISYRRGQTEQTRPVCNNCGKHHLGSCLWDQDVCYKCGQPGHMAKGCRNLSMQRQPMTQMSQAIVPVNVPMGRESVDKGKRPMQAPSQGTDQPQIQSTVGRG